MRRGLIFLLVFVLLLIAPTAVRYLQHYQLGGGDRTEPPTYDVAAVVESVPTPASASFVDAPETFGGLVLLDQSHDNAFTLDEIGYLDGRLAARGVEMISFTSGDLATALRGVNAFVVITPLQQFAPEEIRAVENFVRRGGRLLMLGDPTRYNVVVEEDLFSFNVFVETDKIPLNSLANSFDLIFNGDYLYNTIENEGNFRNIILDAVGFADSPFTADLEQVALYGTHSIQVGAGAEALMAGDDNIWSSATDRPGGLTLAATSANGNVLAVGDIQFMMEPYYTVLDNGRFIVQIADFLAEPTRRDYSVADFPYFFAEQIDLVYTGTPELGPDAFDEIITLQASLRAAEKELNLATAESQSGDAIYLGLFNQADDVTELLADAGISLMIDPEILTEEETAALENADETDGEADAGAEDSAAEDADAEDAGAEPVDNEAATEDEPVAEDVFDRLIQSELGNVQMSGTALILLDESGGQRRLVVLAASKEGLENTVNRLLDLIPLNADYALADCLLQDNLALCPTNVVAEDVEAELLTGGVLVAGGVDEDGDEDTAVDAEEEPTDEGEEPTPTEIDAIDQGSISLDETVEGTLGLEERFSWTYQDGPAVIDIIVESSEDLDAVLELYDANNIFLAASDSGFTGEDEAIIGYEISDDEAYTIIVRDFFDDGGEFVLTVAESSEAAPGDDGDTGEEGSSSDVTVFLFVDDDGAPIGSGFTSQTELETLLSENYTVDTWVSSSDGPLAIDALENADLVIWDSGDYLDSEGFFGEDTFVIFEYLDAGGSIFMNGSSPTIFGDLGLSEVTDLEFTGEDELLLAGFEAGDVLELDATYEVIFADFLVDDLEPGSIAFLLRGANSDDAGNVIGLASIDDANNDQKTAFLLVPFAILPEEAQGQMLDNIMAWFGF